MTTPAYKALTAVGGTEASADLARNAREGGATRWAREGTSKGLYSDDPQRAERVRTTIEEETPMVWALGLSASCCRRFAPAAARALRGGADRAGLRDGGGGRARRRHADPAVRDAVLLARPVGDARVRGVRRALARAARGRERLLLVGGGRRAGRASRSRPSTRSGSRRSCSGVYAMRRSLRRGAAYAAGVAAGVAPLVAYNLWAFGSVTHSSYTGAVAIQGDTGHDVVGLNDGGFFGIDLPGLPDRARPAVREQGPDHARAGARRSALVGLVLLHRRGLRAEAYVIGGLFLRLPDLQLGLLAAVRRRLARPALPDPGAAVPRGPARARVATLAGHRARRWPRRPPC